MSQYKYSPLKSDSSIRLITFDPSSTPDNSLLTIQLSEAQLSETGSFEALSYTWGDLSDKVPIKIGDQTLMITLNLKSFLKHLKANEATKDQASTYWADQICINQDDIPERNCQVALMAAIYSKSCRTLVWLGEQSPLEAAALELLQDIDMLGFTRDHPVHLALPRVVEVIEARIGE
ncbi:heterokaryon incompatibility protein-domain-containing protein [Echria macrotheca]|uniref:Heterokaryon incompatibility protein-domain-containing protein n=1 Tax=Echria macrotheca TaxID=438768 RepID=A0AAJ0BLK5_9PEZI|nr:heterokaryon incompatibility protein-domain-containing protein [Echria macrotheca]